MVKTDSSGTEEWNQTFGGISWEYGRSVQQTQDGGYIIAGTTLSYGAGDYDIWLIRLEAELGVITEASPTEYVLHRVYPNPFNARTTISFTLPRYTHLKLTVYDISGCPVVILADGWLTGAHEITWNASGIPSGVYLYRLEAGDMSVGKMVLMK